MSGPREADKRLSVVSIVLSWGINNGRVFSNHISGFDRLHQGNRTDKLWLPQHITAFMEVAQLELQRALILALHTGQRQGDLLQLVWTNYDGNSIALTRARARGAWPFRAREP